jgi:hypothetical protein
MSKSAVSPLYPQEPTSSVRPATSEKCQKETHACTNFEKNAGTHLHDTHRAVEEPSTASMADIANSLSVPRANAFHMAKQSHQIRNLNVFERMHGIFDLAARPFVGVTGRESVELFDGLLPREGTGGEPWKILNLVFDDLTVL